jgi:hypothetical protein
MTGVPNPSSQIEIACPGCGKRFHKALAWLKTNNVVQCPDCRRQIGVRRYKAQAAAAALFEKLTGFVGGTKGS